MIDRRAFLKGALATTPLVLSAPARLRAQPAQAKGIGPSTTTEPYLLPSIPGVATISILTAGDAVGGHRMVGIPDGLGVLRHGHELTLFMNHEITAARPGIVRAHGSNGAFVSRWTIDRRTLAVQKLEDHTQSPNDVHLWDSSLHRYVQGTTQWQRLCSADLAAESAFSGHGLGIDDRLFLDGEEVTEGRAWARVASGPTSARRGSCRVWAGCRSRTRWPAPTRATRPSWSASTTARSAPRRSPATFRARCTSTSATRPGAAS